jgi:hypothetical protein
MSETAGRGSADGARCQAIRRVTLSFGAGSSSSAPGSRSNAEQPRSGADRVRAASGWPQNAALQVSIIAKNQWQCQQGRESTRHAPCGVCDMVLIVPAMWRTG